MNRKTKEVSRKSLTGRPVVRDRQFYLNSLDVEDALMKRAVSLAERMFAAFVRENNIQVTVDADDVADKILKKLEPQLVSTVYVKNGKIEEEEDKFSFDNDEPVILKTEKMEIKGSLGVEKQSGESTKSSLDALEGFAL